MCQARFFLWGRVDEFETTSSESGGFVVIDGLKPTESTIYAMRMTVLKEWSADFQGEKILKRISTDFLSDSQICPWEVRRK